MPKTRLALEASNDGALCGADAIVKEGGITPLVKLLTRGGDGTNLSGRFELDGIGASLGGWKNDPTSAKIQVLDATRATTNTCFVCGES